MRFGALRSSLRRSRAARVLARVARTAIDLFPLTPLGVVTVGAAGLALKQYGLGRVDLLYLVIGLVGLGLGALSLVLTTLVAIGLVIALRARRGQEPSAPLHLECGARTATGFSLPTLWYVPMIRVRWWWTSPPADVRTSRERRRLWEQVIPTRRGHHDAIERRLEITDAFALTKIAFRRTEARTTRITPSCGALERIQLSRSIAAGDDVYSPEGATDGERMDLRGYAPGDPIRFVLWKVFAKTRQLVVRTPERAVSPARRAFAYLVAHEADEPAAGVARRAIESGALGPSFVMGADGVPEDARTSDQALDLLARSGSPAGHATDGVPVEAGAGLSAFLRRASPAPSTRAIVFVPAVDGPWRAKLLAAMRARGRAPLHVVVCTDGLDRSRPRSLWQRLVLGSAPSAKGSEARPTMSKIEALVGALAAMGADVTLVDRSRGHVYTGANVLARTARDAAQPAPRPPQPKPPAAPLTPTSPLAPPAPPEAPSA
jgi:hypothetical protein